MKSKAFTYTKDGATTNRELMVLKEGVDSFEGIDLSKLDASEKTKLEEINDRYEKELQPFVAKAYRKFLKSLMT